MAQANRRTARERETRAAARTKTTPSRCRTASSRASSSPRTPSSSPSPSSNRLKIRASFMEVPGQVASKGRMRLTRCEISQGHFRKFLAGATLQGEVKLMRGALPLLWFLFPRLDLLSSSGLGCTEVSAR